MSPRPLSRLWCGLLLLVAPLVQAAPNPDITGQRSFDAAIDRGLSFLARSQTRDGAFGDDKAPAITALAVMAFLARGYSPGLPPYGDTINRGIDFILSVRAPDGTLMGTKGRLYSHNISCLMLSEVSGMVDPERQARIDAVLPRALQILISAQQVAKPEKFAGGWRYLPTDSDSDISHAGWALAALRSARNNGAPAPKETIDAAVRFILRCQHPNSGFGYQPGGKPNLARSSIGLLCLELAGHHRDAITMNTGSMIYRTFTHNPNSINKEYEQYYALYYIAHAMFQFGGPEWESLRPLLNATLLNLQSPEGFWPPARRHGENAEYSTSMAILTLAVSYRQLPIYQR